MPENSIPCGPEGPAVGGYPRLYTRQAAEISDHIPQFVRARLSLAASAIASSSSIAEISLS